MQGLTAAEIRLMIQDSEDLRTQDVKSTSEPIYYVRERKLTKGLSPDTAPRIAWVNDQTQEWLPAAEFKEQYPEEAKLYRELGDIPPGWHQEGYAEDWIIVQPFFTDRAAKHYITTHQHNHGPLHVWIDSGWKNEQWIRWRKLIMTMPKGTP